jgi:ankyrin repeat protein
MLSQQRKLSSTAVPVEVESTDEPSAIHDGEDSGAVESLAECLRMAEDSHERYTSEYAPDARSELYHRDVMLERHNDSPLALATPASEESGAIPLSQSSLSETRVAEDEDEAEDTWPLPVLSRYIEGAHERASKERDQGHFNQAEINLQSAIRYSEMRERHYKVPFTDRVRLQEEVAQLYQKQGKFGEAVAKVHQLLRESPNELGQARQHQLLAAIYFDRHQGRNGPALSHSTDDAANAEKYAQKAFNTRFALLETSDPPNEDVERHYSCTALLVRILETRDKTVEANELTKLLTESSSTASESMRRISSVRPPTTVDSIKEEDKQQLLINAIKAGDNEQVQDLLDDSDVKIEQTCKQGKTPLFYAVECSDETIVHKLLDPANGADVNTCNKKGVTALHHASSLGLHDMVRCLIHHDAEIGVVDKRKETPLMKAVQKDQSLVVQVLYDSGANMEASSADEWSVLHFAVRIAKPDMISQLLDLTPELKDAVDTRGMTALHHCAAEELVDSATALLGHRNHVDVDALDSCSRSALYFAASKPPTPRRESMVQVLVDNGARVNETRPPPRWRDYSSLKRFQVPRRVSQSLMTRHDSVSTEGTVGTTSTGRTKLSRIFSSRMHSE